MWKEDYFKTYWRTLKIRYESLNSSTKIAGKSPGLNLSIGKTGGKDHILPGLYWTWKNHLEITWFEHLLNRELRTRMAAQAKKWPYILQSNSFPVPYVLNNAQHAQTKPPCAVKCRITIVFQRFLLKPNIKDEQVLLQGLNLKYSTTELDFQVVESKSAIS